ncbi:MAG: pantetheine-phosphate adenylyltransferase [Gammaproteobacteria bacterium WSBS_2016_MAG_OTU1]
MIRAVFPGTFDPITLGHEALIHRASDLFDEIIVAVAAGVHKQAIFSLEERLQMAEKSCGKKNVRVMSFEGLLADFLRDHQCRIILRGLRAVSDFEFESQLAHVNKTLDGNLETLFLPPNNEYIHLSSTMVREVALLGGDVRKFVSTHVAAALLQKISPPCR